MFNVRTDSASQTVSIVHALAGTHKSVDWPHVSIQSCSPRHHLIVDEDSSGDLTMHNNHLMLPLTSGLTPRLGIGLGAVQ